MRVGVIGAGPIGLLPVLALEGRGVSQIIATDPLPHRLETAATSAQKSRHSTSINCKKRGEKLG
jgi:threonine dehydrogenase-like Zn-dependent dehydrogenase